MRTGAEVALFVTRRGGREVLLLHRTPEHGGYWHVVAGGCEAGETTADAARRELHEETGLVADLGTAVDVSEYVHARSAQPAGARRDDSAVVEVRVTCFAVAAPDDWEPTLDWEHDAHRWCGPEEAAASLRWPETAGALRRLVAGDHAAGKARTRRSGSSRSAAEAQGEKRANPGEDSPSA
jgi:8-oxo-dGTP pyrophosphatase MutT (NUDIX family)